jgi:hypothetical protein
MQADLQRELEGLGFSERQARVYVTLLRFGKSGAQQIATAAGLPRASCYDTLEQLAKQGLVKAVEENSQQVFATEPPGRINLMLALQLEEVQARRRRAEAFLPRLEALAGDGDSRPRFRIINDTEELRKLHQEYAELGKPHLQIVGYDAFLALHKETTVQENAERLRHKPSHGRAILVTDLPVDAPIGSGFEVRRVPTAMMDVKGEMAVCGDRVILFAFTDKVVAIEIISQSMANTCWAALELAWQRAGEIEEQLQGRR